MTAPRTTAEDVRSARVSLGVGGAAYFAWWFVVHAMFPGDFNPLGSRLAVVAACWGVVLASFLSARARERSDELLALCMGFVTVHYFYLLHMNHGDATWWGGALITVAAAAALFSSRRYLLVYTVLTSTLALSVAAMQGELEHSVFPPGVITVLVLGNFALRSRQRMLEERVRVITAERERDRAQEANRAKSAFMALVSHELLTPLQTIQLSLDGVTAQPNRANATNRIRRAVTRLTSLIQSLLVFSAAEKGDVRAEESLVSASEIAQSVVDEVRARATAKGLALQLQLPVEDTTLRTDPDLLALALLQLVDNAIAHTEQGSVEVEVYRAETELRLAVRDSGPGIAGADQERIFDSFTQLGPIERKHAPGLGLGLSIVREVVRVLGARVDVKSQLGGGSTFTLVLPRASRSSIAA